MSEKTHKTSIGGQAVMEGVMMKGPKVSAISVRKPDGEIEVEVDVYRGVMHESKITKIPFLRGIFNFIDSLMLGTKTLNYSASFYEDEDAEETKTDKFLDKLFGGNAEKILMGFTTVLSVVLAVAIFIVLPYFLASLLQDYVRNTSLMAIIEGAMRIVIFLLYVVGISAMKDIKRVYQYHGAEHKCINCIEKGRPLTVKNVMRSSRQHKRCGTSFLLIVMCISILFFMVIRVDSPVLKLLLRLVLIPVIAGVSYEILRAAGNSDSKVLDIISRPGLLLQRLTTREPDEQMVEVAIASVEAAFDWKEYVEKIKEDET